MNITFLEAGEDDVDIVTDYRMAFSDELNGKQSEAIERNLRDNLNAYFKAELGRNYICWYASVNGDVAAIGGLGIRVVPGNIKNPSGVWGYIMSIYTVPQYRRQGLCKQILERLVNTARERGVTAFELHATKEGEPVYVQSGFVQHSEPTYRKFFVAD
ncbi:MAG: GNAT family N-acetyltransferase [Bacteroidota bacterium]